MTREAITGQVQASAAEVYEEFFVPALFAQWTDPVLDAARVGSGQRVLDVGCGTGVLARAAVERVGDTGSVIGLDCNEGMLRVAARTSAAVTWRSGVAEDMPFADDSFDRVVSQFALMFFVDRRRALAEMARVVAPGGSVAVTTWCAADESPGYAAMVSLLRRIVGDAAAEALLTPFSIGDAELLRREIAPVFPSVEIVRRDGEAVFPSLDAWLHTEIRGWTLLDLIDDATYARLRDAAASELAPLVSPSGAVRFAASALIAIAQCP